MKKRYEKLVIEALSEITGVPEESISTDSSLKELAGKINVDINGLLDRLCMNLLRVVSNDNNPTIVRDILINEPPRAWR